jgi:hypothetical protein
MKRIPYVIRIGVKDIDGEEYQKNFDNIQKEINTYIRAIEFHEKVHAYIFGLFGVPCVITYIFRYSPYFIANSGYCMPLKSMNRFQTILADVLHFFWDLFDILDKSRSNQLHSRSPQRLLKELILDITPIRKFTTYRTFNSLEEIRTDIEEFALKIIQKWDQGIYQY